MHARGCLPKRAILASGSLHLSPPQNIGANSKLINRLRNDLATRGHSLDDGPSSSLVQSLTNCGIVSMWLQQEPGLDNWEDRAEQVDALMVSDVEYEVRYSDTNPTHRLFDLLLVFYLVCDLAKRHRNHGCG